MTNSIPKEMRQRAQWVIVKLEGKNKIPYMSDGKTKARVSWRGTWSTYDKVKHAKHVGYVLAEDDPYVLIDLDTPITKDAKKLLTAFKDTYIERSLNGGYHIVCKAKRDRGTRKKGVEVYPDKRFVLMTGKATNGKPIIDCQKQLNKLLPLPKEHKVERSTTFTFTDTELIAAIQASRSGDKFDALCNGDIRDYESQSEADLALLSILCFYSADDEQIKRLFLLSALGKRKKAQRRDYLARSIEQAKKISLPKDYDNEPFIEQATKEKKNKELTFPSGLVGEVAQHILTTSIHPMRESAIAASLGLMAGMVGRQFNVSNTGLNIYLILVAPTGTGKEGMASGLDSIVYYMSQKYADAQNIIGPGAFSSGPALIKTLAEDGRRLSFVSIFGEIAVLLRTLATGDIYAHTSYKAVLLDLYHKSGKRAQLRSSRYSNINQSVPNIPSPAFTLLGETATRAFYDTLTPELIGEGLLPRFLILEYKGKRSLANRQTTKKPPTKLINKLVTYAKNCDRMAAKNQVIDIELNRGAQQLSREFEAWTTRKINKETALARDDFAQLWNRAHLKALRIAGLVTVGEGKPFAVSRETMEWAISFVKRETKNLQRNFMSGNVGMGTPRQNKELLDCFKRLIYSGKYPENRIPFLELSKLLQERASFRRDPRGATEALHRALNHAEEVGLLVKLELGHGSRELFFGPTNAFREKFKK